MFMIRTLNHKIIERYYPKNNFRMTASFDGPQNQMVFILRFPISYKNIQLFIKRIDFGNYFDWMGQAREFSLLPINNQILRYSRNGKNALVTNSVKLNVLGFLRATDIVEVRLWLDNVYGFRKLYHLKFDFLKVLPARRYERVALGDLVFSCVNLEHSTISIVDPPAFLKRFLEGMKPQDINKRELSLYKSQFSGIDSGRESVRKFRAVKLLYEQKFQTSKDDSNLIGNVYFSNYAKWSNLVKDRFFYDLIRKHKTPRTIYEYVVLNCKVSHFNEAMPFDVVCVRMYLRKVFTRAIIFGFEIFCIKDKSEVKLANVTQTVVLVKKSRSVLQICNLPGEVVNAICK